MANQSFETKPFDTQKSVRKATENRQEYNIVSKDGQKYFWYNKMDRLEMIRKGIPYQAIEVISNKLNRPIKFMLGMMGIPQTTYNKKKKDQDLLDARDSELIALITELLSYGLEVFNEEEEKFQRWLNKPNRSLGGNIPISLLDTSTGISEVRYSLNRIEHGNLA